MSLKIRSIVALAGIAAAAVSASAQFTYSVDDGTAEDSIGLNATTYTSVWINTFTVSGANSAIDEISIAYGTPAAPPASPPLNGKSVTILLYTDADGGSPQNASLVWSFNTTIAGANTNTFNTYALPNMVVGTNFAVGFLFNEAATTGSFPAGWDSSAPILAGRSYAGFQVPNTPSINPANLLTIPAGQFGTIEGFGLAGNFLIRAHGVQVPTPGAAGLALVGLAGLARRRR